MIEAEQQLGCSGGVPTTPLSKLLNEPTPMTAIAVSQRDFPTIANHSGSEDPLSSVITCPHCGKRARWMGYAASRAPCPRCGVPLVVLLDLAGEWRALLETDSSVEEMISDWLAPEYEEDEDDDDVVDIRCPREYRPKQPKP